MANNYPQFSVMLNFINSESREEQISWVRRVLSLNNDDPPDDAPEDYYELDSWLKEQHQLAGIEEVEDLEYWPDFSWEVEDDGIWIYTEEGGNTEDVANFVRAFLRRFDHGAVPTAWTMTWAMTYDRPRLKEFEGGAVAVTRDGAAFERGRTTAKRLAEGLISKKI